MRAGQTSAHATSTSVALGAVVASLSGATCVLAMALLPFVMR